MGGGGGVDYSNPFGGATGASNPRGNFASAEDVFRAQDIADFFAGPGQLARAAGPIGMLVAGLGKKGSELYANNQWGSFNRGIDSDAAARAEAMSLGGMGTYSDRQGNLGTISNQDLIDAYDREMFGTTGAEMNAERNGWSRSENESGGSVTDAGGGSFDYSADTGYDR
jgi:hypothetical protein